MKSDKKIDIDRILGKIFKEYRTKNKLTQEQIAEELEISVKYISRIENGTGGVKVETLVNYMNILSISPNVIFEKLIENDTLKRQIELSKKINELPKDKIDFIVSIVDLIKNL
ncbi:MAG: helix-turn-helix transcriptional regulator [Clostridia bacterium]|jgi:transcriptional regulator with XRE-family HTH domain|nr:helix-turn-helix transcriptional regulator [Clostridia bacterium]